jgi:hypothetical protein
LKASHEPPHVQHRPLRWSRRQAALARRRRLQASARRRTLTLLACFEDYITEHCIPTGGDPERAWIAFYAWINALGHDRECASLTRADGRTVVEHELARGVSSATARKHLTMGLAALNHARKEERIDKVLPPSRCRPRRSRARAG